MISHNRIHRILIESGMAMEDPNKRKQRKWVRYERKHSNSLWHMDWAEYREEQLLVIEDDASRYIVGFGSFESATTENSLIVLMKATEEHGKPREIMTDHGTQFFSNGKNGEPGGPNEFQRFLESEGIRHILARVKVQWYIEGIEETLRHLGGSCVLLQQREKAHVSQQQREAGCDTCNGISGEDEQWQGRRGSIKRNNTQDITILTLFIHYNRT